MSSSSAKGRRAVSSATKPTRQKITPVDETVKDSTKASLPETSKPKEHDTDTLIAYVPLSPQRQLPAVDETVKDSTKLKGPLPTDSKPTRPKEGALIAYVHNLSPQRPNRNNTCEYSTMDLQTSQNKRKQALLYSPNKRSLFSESQRCHTPVKLKKFTFTDDKTKVIINDMTLVSVPKQDEYSFQYSLETEPEVSYKKVTVAEILKDGKQWDEVDIQAKVVEIGPVRKVQRRTSAKQGQQTQDIDLRQAILADTTGSIHLDIWSRHTEQLKLGTVYHLCPLGVRIWSNQKKLCTTINTNITVVEHQHELEALEHEDTPILLDDKEMTVNNILTVDSVEQYTKCLNKNCQRKLVQLSAKNIAKCDRCGHTMRISNCESGMMAKIVVEQDGETHQLTIMNNVLQTVLGSDYLSLPEYEVAERLLNMENIQLKYRKESRIVSEINITK